MLLWEQGLQSLTDSIRTQSLASSREVGCVFPGQAWPVGGGADTRLGDA